VGLCQARLTDKGATATRGIPHEQAPLEREKR
jgi:hypothetical protein